MLVDWILHHAKDLCPCLGVTTSEEDSNGTSSESGAENLLHDDENAKSDNLPKEGAAAETPIPRSTFQKQLPPSCHLCDSNLKVDFNNVTVF